MVKSNETEQGKREQKDWVGFYWVGCQGHASSAMLSRYRQTRRLLAAPFRAWPMRTLIRTTWTNKGLLHLDHVDAILSADIASTLCVNNKDSHPQTLQQTQIALALQTCATRPIWEERVRATIYTEFCLLFFSLFFISPLSRQLERSSTENIDKKER